MPGATDVNDLAEPLRTAVQTLIRESGGRVYLVSGRRSRDQQIALRKAHCGTSKYAIYDAPASSCSPPTARPGSSKHETGEAADLGGDLGYAHARANELHIHFPVGGEDWHAESTLPTLGNGSSSLGFGAPTGLPGADAIPTLTEAGAGVIRGVEVLTDPETWKRIAYVGIGVVLAALGVVMLTGSVSVELPSV